VGWSSSWCFHNPNRLGEFLTFAMTQDVKINSLLAST
jgi:hypothetical protein